jgi:hypothetical protein
MYEKSELRRLLNDGIKDEAAGRLRPFGEAIADVRKSI